MSGLPIRDDVASARPLPRHSRHASRFARFVAVSSVAATANFGARVFFNQWTSYAPAVMLAFLIGLSSAFVLNRAFVFRGASNHWRQQLAWFVIVNLLALAQTLVVSLVLADWLFPRSGFSWHAPEVAHAAGILAPVLVSYLAHRRYSFRGAV